MCHPIRFVIEAIFLEGPDSEREKRSRKEPEDAPDIFPSAFSLPASAGISFYPPLQKWTLPARQSMIEKAEGNISF